MTEVNKKEALRWAKDGCKPLWCKHSCSNSWNMTSNPNWCDNVIYITDDSQAELRKLQTDKPETEFEFLDCDARWKEYKPYWCTTIEYRVKPKFKIGDKIINKNNVVCVVNELFENEYGCKEDKWNITIPYTKQNNYQLYIGQFEYPIFKVANKGTSEEYIVRFISLNIGKVVFARENSCKYVGYYDENWIEHTDTTYWEDVLYNKEIGLYDKQPVLCWYNNDKTIKLIRFYDYENNYTFKYSGIRNGYGYDNIIPYSHPDDDFVVEMYKNLKD